MKIIKNLPFILRFPGTLPGIGRAAKIIDRARAAGDKEAERAEILRCTSTWGRNVCSLLGINIEVKGYENLPEEGPVVYVANPQSYTDVFISCAVLDRFQFGYIYKEEFSKIPLMSKWLDRIRSIKISRGDARESLKSINEGAQYIKEGFSIMIFPEGTRSRSSQMGPFKPGAMKLATKAGVPIIPISMDGNYRLYEEDGIFKGGDVSFIIHPPIETANLTPAERRQLGDKVYDIIRKAPNLKDSNT